MLLAVDTSTLWIGMALYDGAAVVAEQVWHTQNHHTVELAPAVDQLLRRSGVKPSDLECLGVALGPGSFTSLRIGLALVKGLALALHLPVVGVPTLDILAEAQPVREIPLLAVLQVGRKRLAIRRYEAVDGRWAAKDELDVKYPEEFAESLNRPVLVCGELPEDLRGLLRRKRKSVMLVTPAASLRRPAYLAEIAWRKWQDGDLPPAAAISPIYLHVNEETPIPD